VRDRMTVAAFLLIVLLAGGNGVAIRFSNHELAPLWGATLRFAIATVVLLLAVTALRIPLPRGRAAIGSTLYGILGFGITFGLAYWGLVDVGAGLAQIILALVPLFTFLLAVVQGLERFRLQTLAGTVIALAGIAVIFGDQVREAVPLISMLAVVGGALSMAESNVVIKRFPRAHPVATNAVAMGAATMLLLAATLLTAEPRSVPTMAQTWLAIGYVSVIGSVGVFTLFVYVIARWSASASSYVMLLIPLVTVFLGVVLDHEVVTWAYLIGGPMVLAGVYVGVFAPPIRFGSRQHAPEPMAPASAPAAWVVAEAPQTDDGLGNPGCS
jgi:drug/metabolite transporter (DMT)-like permease